MADHRMHLWQPRILSNALSHPRSLDSRMLPWLSCFLWRPRCGYWQQRHDMLQCEQFRSVETSCPSNPQSRISVRFRGARTHGFNRAICEPTFVPKVGQRRQGSLLKATSQCLPLVCTRLPLTGYGPSTSSVLANSSSKRSSACTPAGIIASVIS